MLRKINRLTQKSDFQKIVKNGRRFPGPLFDTVCLTIGEKEPSKFGFIISNRLSKKAVLRNRVKRYLRESVFQLPKEAFWGIESVFYGKRSIISSQHTEIRQQMNEFYSKLKKQ